MPDKSEEPAITSKAIKLLDELRGYFSEFKRLKQLEGYLCFNPSVGTIGAHTFDREGEAFQLNLETEVIEIYDRRIFGFIQSFMDFTNPAGYKMKITEQSFERAKR